MLSALQDPLADAGWRRFLDCSLEKCASFPFSSYYEMGSISELCRTSRNGLPAFFSFSASRAVQLQSSQAQGSEPFSSRHLWRSWASCTFRGSNYCFQYGGPRFSNRSSTIPVLCSLWI